MFDNNTVAYTKKLTFFLAVKTTSAPNAIQTTAKNAGTSMENTKKIQMVDPTSSKVTSEKQATAEKATTLRKSTIKAQTTQDATTPIVSTTTQTTEASTSVAISSAVQGKQWISIASSSNCLKKGWIFINRIHSRALY